MKKTFKIAGIVFISIFLSGCFHVKKTQTSLNAGVFKSLDRGQTWQSKAIQAVPGGVKYIRDVPVRVLKMDPQDNSAIYLGTDSRGLFYTYNGGEYWQQPAQLSSGQVNDILIDPKSKCTIYAAIGNKVVKSTDCNRSWFDVYIDPRPKNVTSIAIDFTDSRILYLSTDFGEIIKSFDAGNSWTTIQRFPKSAVHVVVNSANTDILYAAVLDRGVFRSQNGGTDWEETTENFKKTKGIFTNFRLHYDDSQNDGIYFYGKYGIVRSDNGGEDWEILNLITPPLSTDIYSFILNPENGNQIYYGTSSTLYRSFDRGANWSVKRLPSAAVASAVLVDPVNPNILYLGTKLITQKKK